MRYEKILAGALTLALAACNATGEATEQSAGVQAAAVEVGDLRITAEATGTVEPIRKVEVKSKASGEILRLHVDVGDEVSPGTLLAEVDPRDVRNRFDQTVADLEVAQARADIAQAQLGRSRELHEAGVITQQELESANLEYANAQANLIKARTNKDLAELQLSDVTIRAPMSGTVLEKNVEEGQVIQSASQNVSGGTTLYVMASLGDMQVRTLVDETDMGELRAGMPAEVAVEAFPDRSFQGIVEKIEPQATVVQNVTMFPVIVRLDNRAGLLRPGMNAEVEILIDQATDVLLVPNNAVVLPQDVGPAALVLGLDVEGMDLRRFGRGGLGGAMGGGRGGNGRDAGGAGQGRPGAPSGAPSGAASDDRAGGADAGWDVAAREARMQELREQVRSGAITRDSMRAVLASMRAAAGVPARPGAAPGEGGGEDPGTGAPTRRTRRAVVFVVDSAGAIEPRPVEIGLNDWDRTQIVSGVEEGERIALIGAAQLQAQQQEFLNRIRSRQNSPFGGGRGR